MRKIKRAPDRDKIEEHIHKADTSTGWNFTDRYDTLRKLKRKLLEANRNELISGHDLDSVLEGITPKTPQKTLRAMYTLIKKTCRQSVKQE